jgi:hypothetical protein
MCDFGKCEICGKAVDGEEARQRLNPYAYEVHGDESLHVLCDECCERCADDV